MFIKISFYNLIYQPVFGAYLRVLLVSCAIFVLNQTVVSDVMQDEDSYPQRILRILRKPY